MGYLCREDPLNWHLLDNRREWLHYSAPHCQVSCDGCGSFLCCRNAMRRCRRGVHKDASYHNVYIDLSRKSSRQLANIAIVKQKMEEDFVSFKLRMFFQLMLDYSILSEDEYYEILYGTTDRKKIYLVKTGLTINLINRLEKDDQLKNITFDDNGNLVTNDSFEDYLKGADDFYRFELSRFL